MLNIASIIKREEVLHLLRATKPFTTPFSSSLPSLESTKVRHQKNLSHILCRLILFYSNYQLYYQYFLENKLLSLQ